MSKNYNLSSSSDMKRFQRDLQSTIMNRARESVANRSYDWECPHCHKKASFHSGMNVCQHCGKNVDVKLNINF